MKKGGKIATEKKPKILLVFCGGTIAMGRDKVTNILRPMRTIEELLELAPELKKFANVDYEFVANLDSSNIQTHHWAEMAQTIKKNYEKYDGFVVTHGTDTMVYSASAMALALQKLNKPVVFTGAQMPPEDVGSDAKTNLINAFRVATMDVAEVMICFGRKILRGIRSHKWSEEDLEPFRSPLFPQLGEIGTTIHFSHRAHLKKAEDHKLVFKPQFKEGIAELRVSAVLPTDLINLIVDSKKCSGIILQGFGSGNIPSEENSFISVIKHAVQDKNIPVLISTQCSAGRATSALYEPGYKALKAGAIPTGDMTYEAATVKLSWILAQTRNINEIKAAFNRNYAGEITL